MTAATDRRVNFNIRKRSSLGTRLGSLQRTANYYQRCTPYTLLWRSTLLLHSTCTAKYGLEVRDKFCYCHISTHDRAHRGLPAVFSVLWGAVLREECSLAAYWCLDHIVHNVGWNIDLVCDNNDPTSHSDVRARLGLKAAAWARLSRAWACQISSPSLEP